MLTAVFMPLTAFNCLQDLLSKSKHYDWKLRAIKTTLYVAGGMKRAAPELTEDKVRQGQQVHTGGLLGAQSIHSNCLLAAVTEPWHPFDPSQQVLLRALRDFNLGKLTSDDTSIFVGLLNDLFPKTLELVPRARELGFEAKVGRARGARRPSRAQL